MIEINRSRSNPFKGWSGIFLTYKLRPYLGLKTGLLYSAFGEEFIMTKNNVIVSPADGYGPPTYSNEEKIYDINSKKTFLGIPLMVQGTMHITSGFSADLAAGVCFQWLLNGSSVIRTKEGYEKLNWKNENEGLYKKHSQSFISQVKLVYDITSSIGIFAGGQFNYFISSISKKDQCIQEKPHANTFMLGIKYRFR
jgi:hypothetical protein